MIKYLVILLFICTSIFAQESIKSGDKDLKVLGIIFANGQYYFHTEIGLLPINQNEKDPWEEYYRKIYNDSTIVNPNTEIEGGNVVNPYMFLNPAVNLTEWAEEYSNFDGDLYLHNFITIDENGVVTYKPGILTPYLDSLNQYYNFNKK